MNKTRIDNHLTLLDSNVTFKTYAGTMQGHEGMKGFLQHVGVWKNSHHIENTKVNFIGDDSISLDADIVYQNILPTGDKNNYKLHYVTTLSNKNKSLPILESLELQMIGKVEGSVFEDAYLTNRVHSFVYYWLSMLDGSVDIDVAKDKLLTTDFFCSIKEVKVNATSCLDKLAGNNNASNIQSHHFENLTFNSSPGGGKIDVYANVVSKKSSPEKAIVSETTNYHWQLVTSLDDTFAKAESVEIKK